MERYGTPPPSPKPYRLADLPEAFRLFGRGDHKGKIVVSLA
jgi:hypothetical protein